MTARAIAALPLSSTGPILVLVAEVSKGKVAINFPCLPAFAAKEFRELAEQFRSGEFDAILKWLYRHCGPDCICDNCGEPLGGEIAEEDIPSLEYLNLLCVTPFGPKTYFICEWCRESWKSNGSYLPPKVMAKAMAGVDYRKRANA
jgi:hypothetical protein